MSDQLEIKGFCADAFAPIRKAFEQNFVDGREIGASIAIAHQDKMVVDLWGGFADQDGNKPWEENTIACVFSTTKIMTIICTLMVIDRGLLDLDTPVAFYWPGFGKHGKDKITLRDAMTHRALIPAFTERQPFSVMQDWDRMIGLIEDEKPWFEPGTFCYHPIIFGHILGELVRRVTGMTIREFFIAELSDPLKADFHMGLSNREDQDRVALLTDTAPFPFEEGSIEDRVMNGFLPSTDGINPWMEWDQMSALIPASSGYGNARSLARIAGMLAMGGVSNGRRYLSAEIVAEAHREQCHEVCPVAGDITFGLGFGLDGELFPAPTPSSYHWGGYGGSWCVIDPVSQTSAAYVMNNLFMGEDLKDPRMENIWEALQDVLLSLRASTTG